MEATASEPDGNLTMCSVKFRLIHAVVYIPVEKCPGYILFDDAADMQGTSKVSLHLM